VELFNAGAYFEAHEAFEALWARAPLGERFFLQALVHYAVGLHHHQRGNRTGAVRQLDKALRKIAGYLPAHRGVDTARLWRDGQRWRDAAKGGWRIDLATIAMKA
jgi:hypothetical protein